MIAADVTPAGYHFLCLLPLAKRAVHADARAGSLSVFAIAHQAHGNARGGSVVAVDQCRPLEAVYNGIEITVIVEVSERHAVAVMLVVKSPLGTDLLEA